MISAESEQLQAELQSLNAYLLACERRIHQGEVMDMSGFDEKTKVICQKLSTLPPERARDLAPELETLISRLDRISAQLQN